MSTFRARRLVGATVLVVLPVLATVSCVGQGQQKDPYTCTGTQTVLAGGGVGLDKFIEVNVKGNYDVYAIRQKVEEMNNMANANLGATSYTLPIECHPTK